MNDSIVMIGYAGHAYVAIEILHRMGLRVSSYFDKVGKASDPYNLQYLGSESDPKAEEILRRVKCFVAIGDNAIRERAFRLLSNRTDLSTNAIDPSAHLSDSAKIGVGILCGPRVIVNALATIGTGAILNSGSIVEHECRIGEFAHIAPGAILAGGVQVGPKAFVGANATVREGVQIGAGAIVGAGAVVVSDVESNSVVVGVPARRIRKNWASRLHVLRV